MEDVHAGDSTEVRDRVRRVDLGLDKGCNTLAKIQMLAGGSSFDDGKRGRKSNDDRLQSWAKSFGCRVFGGFGDRRFIDDDLEDGSTRIQGLLDPA